MHCFNLKRNHWVKLFLLFFAFSFNLTFLNGQVQIAKETNPISNNNRNRFSMDELKVRWKKLALETCVVICSTSPSISSIITTGTITASTASFSGNILSDGGFPVLAKGIIWSTSPNPTVALSTKTNDGPGTGPFTSNITGLSPGTTYYVRFYVTNSSGTTYGTEINFSTGTGSPATIGITVSTSSITATSATSGGNISSDGGYPGTTRGVVWSTTTNPTVPSASSTSDGTGTGAFTSNITGLSATTLYYVRSYATNPAGTTYGSEISFTTLVGSSPSISSTSAIGSITTTSASSGGNISSDGGYAITARGVVWGTSPSPTVPSASSTTNGTGTGSFTSNITGLSVGTLYYVRSYATNSAGTSYGTEISFTTSLGSLATLTTAAAGSITTSTASSGGNISADGGSPITARGVVWATTTSPTISLSTKTTDGTGTGAFTSNITGLTAGTLYYVRSYATNTAGTSYGTQMSFTTSIGSLATISATVSAASITSSTATSGGNITTDGGSSITARGVVWATTTSPTISLTTKTSDGTGTGSFTSNITGLYASTLYYVRSYATNAAGTSYGSEISFTTNIGSTPTLSATSAISAITTTTASSGGNITAAGDSPITARGVVWGTATSPTTSLTTKTSDGTGIGSFTSNITGLSLGTTYYVRSYATNSSGTSYGTEISFTTSAGSLATLNATVAAGSITTTSATSGGNITADGGSPITARGVVWGTSASPTVPSASSTSNGTGTGSFTSNITGLNAGTLYYVRSYATNLAGTSYGAQISFTTSAGSLATLTTVAAGSITTSTAVSGGNITADGGSPITARGVVWKASSSTGLDVSLSTKTSDGTGIGSFTSNITGLSPNTLYYVSSYATNSAGTRYGTPIGFYTLAASSPTISATVTATSITSSAATSGGNITADGGSPITARGVVWSTSSNPTVPSASSTSDGTGTGSFTSNITGLSAGTLYYVRSYATNSVGTSYGTQVSFTTLAICTCASTATCPSTVSDREGNSYNVITLGSQCWMKQNLRVTTLNDGTAIPVDAGGTTTGNGSGYTGWLNTTTSAMTVYAHDASNLTTFGYLYNQYAVNDPKGLCPSGWRVPTDAEWTTLTTCLGGESVAGEKMKVPGTTLWTVNYDANNCSDFSGLPGGFRRNDGLFYFKGENAYFWSSSSAKNRALTGYTKEIRASNDINSYQQNVGLSVRCIKN